MQQAMSGGPHEATHSTIDDCICLQEEHLGHAATTAHDTWEFEVSQQSAAFNGVEPYKLLASSAIQ